MALNNAPIQFSVGTAGGDVISFKPVGTRPRAVKKDTQSTQWVKWYTDNKEPDYIRDLILNNNLNAGIIGTKVNFTVANGVVTLRERIDEKGKRVYDKVKIPEIETFFEETKINQVLTKYATDLHWFGNFFPELLYDGNGKCYKLNHVDASFCRSGKMDSTSRVNEFFVCADWSKPIYDSKTTEGNTVTRIKAHLDGEKLIAAAKRMMHIRSYCPGFTYYSPPSWRGAYDYVSLANQIPVFHDNALKNGYNLKYHIIIPESYLSSYDEAKQEEKRTELRNSLDKFLSGAENPQKAFISFARMIDDKHAEKWEIIPLENNLADDAYTTLFEQTNTAIISAHGIDPTLCGIETQGKLSSGSEKRIAAQLYQNWHAPAYRRLILEPLRIVAKINGWPSDVMFAIEDIELTTLDSNPTGSQAIVSAPV
jgi:capsid portal protein